MMTTWSSHQWTRVLVSVTTRSSEWCDVTMWSPDNVIITAQTTWYKSLMCIYLVDFAENVQITSCLPDFDDDRACIWIRLCGWFCQLCPEFQQPQPLPASGDGLFIYLVPTWIHSFGKHVILFPRFQGVSVSFYWACIVTMCHIILSL